MEAFQVREPCQGLAEELPLRQTQRHKQALVATTPQSSQAPTELRLTLCVLCVLASVARTGSTLMSDRVRSSREER